MNILAESLKRLYIENKVSKDVLERLYAEKRISAEEYQKIIANDKRCM